MCTDFALFNQLYRSHALRWNAGKRRSSVFYGNAGAFTDELPRGTWELFNLIKQAIKLGAGL